MRKRSQCWADTPQALSAKDAGGTAAFYVCISSVRTPEGRRQLEKLKATSKSVCCCRVRAYRPTANSIQVILHSILPRLPWSFSNILHICFYKSLLGFLFFFFFLVSLPIDVHGYKESTAIYCAKLESMNRKVSSFISAVSIGVWRITKDSMNNMNNLKPWKTGFWKGSETACQLACIWWDSHFPTLPSPVSLQPHHCERRKRTTPFSILCVFLCQQLEMLSLSSFLSFHLCKFLH